MPLTLITGPANAGKARVVMDALRAHHARGEQPLLVVPTRADVERYRGELARGGLVEGVRVERFGGLLAEVLHRAAARGTAGTERPLGRLALERVLAAAWERARSGGSRARLEVAAAEGAAMQHTPGGPRTQDTRAANSANPAHATPGVVRALAALVGELEVARVSPARLREALEAWVAADPAHAPRARELAELYAEYRRASEELGRAGPERRAALALDALRRTPAAWGATPVLLYGFDDLGGLQLDTVETLGVKVDAPVTVSLAYELGRTAFAGRGDTFQRLAPLAADHHPVGSRADYYAPAARPALHHVERSLFEPDAPKVPAAGAVRLLEGGGERAELELVAEEIRGLLERGVPAAEIAVAHRAPGSVAELLGEVFRAHGVPFALERRVPFAHTALGRALVGLLAAAFPVGEDPGVGDLLAWLRAPGVLARPELADDLERRARRAGATTAAQARALWEADRWPLETLDRLAAAAQRGPAALVARVAEELERLACTPRHGADEACSPVGEVPPPGQGTLFPAGELRSPAEEALAPTEAWLPAKESLASAGEALSPSELTEARALEAGRAALKELRQLAHSALELGPDAHSLIAVLRGLEVVVGEERSETPAVAVLHPLALRARRVRALFVCGLQEGVFPAPARPEPYLSEEERRGLAEASGLRLGRVVDALAGERYLLYAAVSRPEELLVLSWHTADDDGVPSARSLFVDDVCDLFACDLHAARTRRALGEVGEGRGSGVARPGAALAGLSVEDQPGRGSGMGGPGSVPAGLSEDQPRNGGCEPAGSPAGGSPQGDPPGEQAPLTAVPCAQGGIAPLSDPRVLAELRERRLWSASGLQSWAGCPVRWFVERLLGAEDLEPDAEPLARGGLAHAALRDVLEGLRRETGSARLTPERVPRARELLRAALERHAREHPLSTAPERVPGVRRRLEADLERYLAHAADDRSEGQQESPLEPTHFELPFGFPEEPGGLPALDLGDGVEVRGRVDRVDLAPGGAGVVYDYKGAFAPPPDRWVAERSFQAALYMRAVEALPDVRAVGGFYQPLSGRDLRARGVLAQGEGVELPLVRGDAREPAEVCELVDEVLAAARTAAAQARAGALEARPQTCGFGGSGCVYPQYLPV